MENITESSQTTEQELVKDQQVKESDSTEPTTIAVVDNQKTKQVQKEVAEQQEDIQQSHIEESKDNTLQNLEKITELKEISTIQEQQNKEEQQQQISENKQDDKKEEQEQNLGSSLNQSEQINSDVLQVSEKQDEAKEKQEEVNIKQEEINIKQEIQNSIQPAVEDSSSIQQEDAKGNNDESKHIQNQKESVEEELKEEVIQKEQVIEEKLKESEIEKKPLTEDEEKDILVQEILLLQEQFQNSTIQCQKFEQKNKDLVEEINTYIQTNENLTSQIKQLDPFITDIYTAKLQHYNLQQK